MSILSYTKDSSCFFHIKEKDGKRLYDGTSIFTIDASEEGLYKVVQVIAWYDEDYVIINNITVIYEEYYQRFDHNSYKIDILKEIN